MTPAERQRINTLAEHQTFEDSPELDAAFFATARRVANTPVVPQRCVTAYLDADVFDWLEKTGPRYAAHLNTILRRAMEAENRPD